MNVKPPVAKRCPQCGSEFRRPPSQAGTKFCGEACWFAHHATEEKVYQQCGRSFRRHGHRRSRGSGASYCSRACQSLGARRRVEFRCRDCGRTWLRRPNEVRRFVRCAECGAAYRANRLRGKALLQEMGPEARERWLAVQRSPERRERMSQLHAGKAKTTPLTQRGSPQHAAALHIGLRSPAGVTYVVDNLAEFVRSHPDLFAPEDLVHRGRQKASYNCRATSGLRRLQAVVGTRMSWKGWTLAVGVRDELRRRPVEAVVEQQVIGHGQ